MSRSLTDSRMLRRLKTGGFFPQRCDIQQRVPGTGTIGQPSNVWENVYADQACVIARKQGREQKQSNQAFAVRVFTVLIPEKLDGITSGMRVLADDGRIFDIQVPNFDSQGTMTELIVEIMS